MLAKITLMLQLLLVALIAAHDGKSFPDVGLCASIELDHFTNLLKPLLWNEAVNTMNGAQFGNVTHHHGSMINNTFYITSDATYHTLVPSPKDPLTFTLKAKGFGVAFTSDRFTYKEQLIESHGSSQIQIPKAAIEADIQLNSQSVSGRRVVDFQVKRAKLSIPSDDMDVTVHGNYFGHLSGPLKAVFKKELGAKIEQEMENILKTALPQALNKKIEDAQTLILISDTIKFDSRLADLPLSVVDGWFRFGLKGFSIIGDEQHDTDITEDLCNELTKKTNRTSFSEPESFRAYFSSIDDSVASEILGFVKKVKRHSHFDVNFFDLFRLTQFGSEEMSNNINYVTATVNRATQYQNPESKLPSEDDMASSFWIEHLDKHGSYERKQTRPIGLMVHNWLTRYYDPFGIVKLLERMYLPWVYWLLGEKMP